MLPLDYFDKLYKANYIKVDQDFRNDIERWAVLPLDLTNYCNNESTLIISITTIEDTWKNNSEPLIKLFQDLYGMIKGQESKFKYYGET